MDCGVSETIWWSKTAIDYCTNFNYSKPFTLDTDASDTGIGEVLSQIDDNGREQVIALATRTLSKPESQYCVTYKELLSVVTFVHRFHPFF